MKTIVTVTGIRPDFIRMSKVFEKLDQNFNHIMIHTGQHYDDELSRVFFQDLKLRKPDFTLATGRSSNNHYEQLSYLSKALIETLKNNKINPALAIFLGDANTALASVPLFKEGYKIGHIEGGMRSYDRRMPEEVNRVCCDYVSDLVFVYTPLYKERLVAENKNPDDIYVVGNTMTEIIRKIKPTDTRKGGYILADVHRTENLKTVEQYEHILKYLNEVGRKTNKPIKLVKFNRAVKMIEEFDLLKDKKFVELGGPYGFLDFIDLQYHSDGMISDSGTGQEEGPLLGIPVAVPRLCTERPESLEAGNSIMVGETGPIEEMVEKTLTFFKNYKNTPESVKWLGDGNTSERILEILKQRV